jgi:DNA (cytosine-5)-methyltransferase 1
MRRVRSTATAPELSFRRSLDQAHIPYEVCATDLPGKPDIVIRSAKVSVFIDGDFWHGAQYRNRKLTSIDDQFRRTKNRKYWLRKIHRNVERDCDRTALLLHDGWTVLRFWESDVRKNLERCVEMTVRAISNETKSTTVVPDRTVAEFFAGIGLMRLGLEKEGWKVVFANDIDEPKHEMYVAHFPDAADPKHFVVGDVHKLQPEQVPECTLATASFPCNDLSLAGAREGLMKGKQSSAFWGFMEVLEKMGNKPPLVMLENVTGFLTSHGGRDFAEALIALNDLGYSVDAFILDAVDFVPQSRQRLFVIGKLGTNNDALVAPVTESRVRPRALAWYINNHPEIHWDIRPLPSPPGVNRGLESTLEELPHSREEWWSEERAKYLLSQMSKKHRRIANEMIEGRRWSYGTVFRRIRNHKSMAELRTDNVAGCLRTPRGGSGRQILFKAGKGKYFARLLTPRECARLMGADDFVIKGSTLNQALFGFGDAVCVPVVEWVARHYLNPVVNELMHGRLLQATQMVAKAAG